MRFMAIASVSCASLLIDPNDIAPVAKRLTISRGRLHLLDRHRLLRGLQFHQPAQRAQIAVLLVDQIRVFLERLEALVAHRVLQLADRQRIQQMKLAVHPILISAARIELGLRLRERLISVRMLHLRFARQHFQADAFDARRSPGEVFVDQALVQARSPRTPARRDSFAASRCPSSRRPSAVPC